MKVLNKLLFSILLLAFFFSCQQQEGEIQYINLYITTVKAIDCESLRKSEHKKKLSLTDVENKKLLKIFSNLKSAESDWNIDARLYGFIYDNSERLNFCMSTTIIEINDKKYFVSDELMDYIIKLTTKE